MIKQLKDLSMFFFLSRLIHTTCHNTVPSRKKTGLHEVFETSLTSQYHVGSIVDQERSRFIASFLNPRLISNTFSVTSEFI